MSLTKVSSAVLNVDDLYGFRNRIINGDMRIDQRNAGASSGNISAGTTTYTLDRWSFFSGNTSAVATIQQDSSAPADFTNSLKISVATADSSVADEDRARLVQRIEGYNFADLNYGSANAKTLTLSFWVKSNVTGTFSVVFYNGANNRSFLKNYTIDVADTWEQKTITINGDTTGTWLTTNGVGLNLAFNLMSGTNHVNTENVWQAVTAPYGTSSQANLFSSTSNTFYITGVQLEKGTVATPFERRPYGTELALCQRYAYQMNAADSNGANRFSLGFANSTTKAYVQTQHPVPMRIKPSLTTTAATLVLSDTLAGSALTSISIQSVTSDVNKTSFDCTVASGLTAFRPYYMEGLNSSATLLLSAEL
jgi:hypothetical protein